MSKKEYLTYQEIIFDGIEKMANKLKTNLKGSEDNIIELKREFAWLINRLKQFEENHISIFELGKDKGTYYMGKDTFDNQVKKIWKKKGLSKNQ